MDINEKTNAVTNEPEAQQGVLVEDLAEVVADGDEGGTVVTVTIPLQYLDRDDNDD